MDEKTKGDFDIIIKGNNNIIRASERIKKLTKNEENKLVQKNITHKRRFKFEGRIICPFGITNKTDFINLHNFKKICDTKEVRALITEDSLSLATPSLYKIHTKEGEFFLGSYFVGHCHLLKKGDKIKFSSSLFEFKKGNKTFMAYIIPMEGTWIRILNEK